MVVNLPELSPQEKDNFHIERHLYSLGFLSVAGCDEVGRGPLAGPVVAAAVILPRHCDHSIFLDSKKLSHARRVSLNQTLEEIGAVVGLGQISEGEIDTINILQASLLAMKIAVDTIAAKSAQPDFLLVDGQYSLPIPIPQQTLIKGESKSASVAAASIIAKVARDRLMEKLHEKYPVYNFRKNKGYPTREHRQAIIAHGPSPVHRYSFKGVREHD